MTRDEQFAHDAAIIVACIDSRRAKAAVASRRARILFAAAIQASAGNQELAAHIYEQSKSA